MLSLITKSARLADASRYGLRAAIAARDEARQAVIDARQTLERLLVVVDEADEAARGAANAARTANDFRQAWVRNGCRHSESRELQSLTAAASEAARTAESAALDATPVSKELTRLQSVVQSLQIDLRGREDDVLAEVNAIILAEQRQLLEDLERAAEVYRAARAKVVCLEKFFARDKYQPRHAANSGLVEAALERARILSWEKEREAPRARDYLDKTRREQEWLDSLTAPFRARAEELLSET
jgi:hypothetical protein